MSIMAALAQGGRTVLLGNFDVVDAAWNQRRAHGDAAADWAMENGVDKAMPTALNDAGLAQLWMTAEGGVCQREVFSTCQDVHSGIAHIESASTRGALEQSKVLLADSQCIAQIAYESKQMERKTRVQGYFVCEDRDRRSAVEEHEGALSLRSERMYERVEDLYAWFPILDNEDLVERCRALLCQEPVRREDTSLSVVMDMQERRVDWCVSGAQWQTVWLKS